MAPTPWKMKKLRKPQAGKIVLDTRKPDGTTRKLLDITRLSTLDWSARFSLTGGLEQTYQIM